MKLYMRQKVFTIGDRFNVWDESGSDRWFVEEELFVWGRVLHILDACGREAASIKRQAFAFLPRFYVTVAGEEVAEIVKHFTLFCQEFEVNGPGWTVSGSFWDHSFHIDQGARRIAAIEKEWLTWGDCYTLDVTDPAQELLALAVVLAIDMVKDDN